MVTSSGFEAFVDPEANDDMEVFEGLVALKNGDVLVLPSLVTAFLGEDGKKALYDHCRVNGRVKITKVSEELADIIKGLGSKN